MKIKTFVNCMMKAFKLKNDLKNLLNSLNLINVMNILNIIVAFNQLLNLHLNALRNDIILFKKIVKSAQMCINI